MFDSPQLTPPHPLLHLPQSDSSGSSTPPLWPTTPDACLGLSPASRTQAILRGQRELMDLVRNLPESSYELSLKDLVDLPQPCALLDDENRPSVDSEGHGRWRRRWGYGYGNTGKGQQQQQQQEGFLLKMVFPVYTGAAAAAARGRRGGNRRQRKERSEELSSGAVEKEWWRKRDGDSESGDSLYSSSTIGGSGKSSRSGSSSGSSRSNSANRTSNSVVPVRHESGSGCWSFLRRKNC